MRVRGLLLFLIFCREWRCNNHEIHDVPFFEDKTSLPQKLHYLTEQLFLRLVAYQQIPKAPQCISVWRLVAGLHSSEIRKRPAAYGLSHRCFIRRITQVLQQTDPQHTLQIASLIAALTLVVVRPLSSQHDAFYLR